MIAAVGGIGIWQLDIPHGDIPALGRLLNPFSGFWQNAEPVDFKAPATLSLDGLEAEVELVYDDRLVPHIYAQNLHDLYFAQGYVHAANRLWQMEIQTHTAGGRLSEILGADLLDMDRRNRRLGMVWAAEKTVEFMSHDKSSKEYLAMQAYSEGVNAYISNLKPADYPLEYKLLGYEPEPWTELKTALLLKYMANTLTGTEYDLENSNFANFFGFEYWEKLYGHRWDATDPIIPEGTPWIRDSAAKDLKFPNPFESYPGKSTHQGDPLIGSNNWAISPEKSATGNPILASDPHLTMTLPAIWYEMHLVAPGLNVYGVSLPGSPAVTIGFNDNIAWGITNSSRDVKDWYKIEMDSRQPGKYLLDGEWVDLDYRYEEISIKGREPFIDTVAYTIWGPIVSHPTLDFSGAKDHALRWTAHDPSNELAALIGLNFSQNHQDYMDALDNFECPGQNFAFACVDGDIAIRQQGKFPILEPGQGRFLQDGSSIENAWNGFIPFDENPHILNPERGFISSANQVPTDSTYPYYYGGIYEHYRNRRINKVLGESEGITVEDMKTLQNDNYNWQASDALPFMLTHLGSAADDEKIAMLKDWNYFNNADLKAPSLYQMWWDSLYYLMWDEFALEQFEGFKYPTSFHTTEFITKTDPNDVFYANIMDIYGDNEVQTFKDINEMAFKKAVLAFEEAGEPDWGTAKGTYIGHLGRIEPFGRYDVHCGGNKNIVNATGKTAGPSWRMIVELGDQVKPIGIYPGGQSGNPGSPYFDNFIDDWAVGEYYELQFFDRSYWNDGNSLAIQTLKPYR